MKFYTLIALLLATSLSAGSTMDVEKVFQEDCEICHGSNHEGGIGSDLRPNAINDKDSDTLSNIILNGLDGTAMPSFMNTFSEKEAKEMIKYLRKSSAS